ncbi:hypothetical protein K458DRAFT_371103 [Lentithecium fluviatile CBS 122367]|uniref:Uncharacterized protein n=1 Tax=Lentithecium fluviatile CBS 122367 TaxID=1168545 RepID=A0A6G1IUR9_9PLEO|nr:hypothetical protein K458DRAFT_371103 [Lentithecium fluviatile CBS 122367]
MTLPYQCLAACSRTDGDSNEWALFGATGLQIVVQSSTGVTSSWSVGDGQTRVSELENEDSERPGKRVKLTPPAEPKPNFSTLRLTNDKKHLVGVTAEDKCIRVFQIEAEWRLQQLSERCMARRPCSITLTPDDATILCADKFGDVYALPLLPNLEEEEKEILEREKKEQAKFVPSASVLTVHSGRNRKILEEQLKQAETKQLQSREAPRFKHDLLLGHVSMLTDIVYTTVGTRSYLLTSDRDEHIRISRGLPQAHIIEGFCQGHEEFINRMCITKTNLLVSGGGDADLYVWDWLKCCLLEKLSIRDAVVEFYRKISLSTSSQEPAEKLKVAVSGVWSVPYGGHEQDEILVACEGVPALFTFKPGTSPAVGQALALVGNALDVAFIERDQDRHGVVVSVDHMHKPGSTTEIRLNHGTSRLQYYAYQQDGQWSEDSSLADALEWFNGEAGHADNRAGVSSGGASGAPLTVDEKALRDMLYGVENLRKRPGSDD